MKNRYVMLFPLLTLIGLTVTPFHLMAAKEKFVRTKPHVNVGTIGHVDPGEAVHLTLLNVDERRRCETVLLTDLELLMHDPDSRGVAVPVVSTKLNDEDLLLETGQAVEVMFDEFEGPKVLTVRAIYKVLRTVPPCETVMGVSVKDEAGNTRRVIPGVLSPAKDRLIR